MQTMSVQSLQYVQAYVTATVGGAPYNPTVDVVEFAFTSGSTQPDTWHAGSWDTSQPNPQTSTYCAQILIGPTGAVTLPAGRYNIWIKIHDNPETPVLPAGQLTIT